MRRFTRNRLKDILRPLSSRGATLALMLPLGACSMLQQPDEQTAGTPSPDTNDLPVVENLVSEAYGLRNSHITPLPPLPPSVTENLVEEPVPVEPTVSMSANRVVETAINDYLHNRQTLLRMWIERSHTYFPMIEQIFEEEGVPDELKYIALGESSLNPIARSWVGATGMWQFMAGTARGAGLTVNSVVDERRDPEKSTRAAARHLKELYEAYGQNWHLALAGYNCSYRCITRAVRLAGGSLDDPPSFWEIYPYLPRETRGFIPKFIAASLLVSNPEYYGISADTFGDEMTYDVVPVNGVMDLATAAELAGTSLTVLRTLNPELLRDTLPESGSPYPLKIPAGHHQRFIQAFDELPEEALTVPDEYVVSRGDTLSRIAGQFDISVTELKRANGISGHLIHPGQELRIPGVGSGETVTLASREPKTVNYGEFSPRPIKLAEGFTLVELETSTPEEPQFAVSLNEELVEDETLMVPTIYRVRSGDTLGEIASRYRVSVSELQQWNKIRGHLIRVGQELTIHTGASAPTVTTYEVRRGDSLAAIARRFGVSVERLKQRNGLTDDLIYPGQSLQVN